MPLTVRLDLMGLGEGRVPCGRDRSSEPSDVSIPPHERMYARLYMMAMGSQSIYGALCQ